MSAPLYWHTQAFRLRPYGEKCSCGKLIFPPRDICPECRKEVLPDHPSLDKEILHGKPLPWNVVFFGLGKERGG